MSGLVQRRRGTALENSEAAKNEEKDEKELDDKDNSKFTLMEEIVLLGLKDNEGMLSFWNDNISYVLELT